MPNRYIFSLRFSTKVFFKLCALAAIMLLFMSLFRLNFYWLTDIRGPGVEIMELISAFTAGLRFDLLVLGFLFIPVYFSLMLQAYFERWPRSVFRVYKFYFLIGWLLICVLTYIDFFYFAKSGERMRFNQYMSWTPDIFMEQFESLSSQQSWTFTAIVILLFYLGYSLIKHLKFGQWKDEFSPHYGSRLEMIWRILLPLIMVAFAARGTITPHHLALEHSVVSSNSTINEMALNAVWCFDK